MSSPSRKKRKLEHEPTVNQPETTLSPISAPFLPYPNPSTTKPRQIPFQQPSQLTTFSYDENHVQSFTNDALRYYVDPPPKADLNHAYERWVKREDDRGRIDALLRAVVEVKRKSREGGGELPQIGVVAWRGIITKILTAPYENRDAWDLNVMYIDGTLYLEEHLSDDKLKEKNNTEGRQRKQMYYGYSFESYCTSETPPAPGPKSTPSKSSVSAPGDPAGWGGDVNTNVQWCSVVRTKLGDMRMILGGEVDCVRDKYTGHPDTFVELKTSMAIRGQYDETKFERKLLKFYFQSFLLGVPEIVVGFRTPAGVLTTLQSFKTIQLPRLVRGKPGAWDPLVCLDWGYQVLAFLKEQAESRLRRRTETVSARDSSASGTSAKKIEAGVDVNDIPPPVWRVKFVPGSGMRVEELDSAGVLDVENEEDRVGFLPRWYWDDINSGSSNDTDGEDAPPREPRGETAAGVAAGWKV